MAERPAEHDDDGPDAEALAWFVRLRGAPGDAERRAFAASLAAAPANGEAYARVEALGARTGPPSAAVAARRGSGPVRPRSGARRQRP